VIARALNLRRYILGAKKKYVGIRRRRNEGEFFLAMEVGTLCLDPLSGYGSAERFVRFAIRIFWQTGFGRTRVKTLKCIPTKRPARHARGHSKFGFAKSTRILVGKSVSQRHGDYSDTRGVRYTNLRSR